MTTTPIQIHSPPARRPERRWARALLAAMLAVALMGALAGTLTACGKRGSPEPPPGQKDEFPRTYPDPSTYRSL